MRICYIVIIDLKQFLKVKDDRGEQMKVIQHLKEKIWDGEEITKEEARSEEHTSELQSP